MIGKRELNHFNKSQLIMNDKELSEALYLYLNRFTNRDREFSEILEKYPEVKAAERSMREAINNSVFHDVNPDSNYFQSHIPNVNRSNSVSNSLPF